MNADLLAILCCPLCKGQLVITGAGDLRCSQCSATFPVIDGIPCLLPDKFDRYTQESFEREWAELRDGDTAWGINVESRIPHILDFLGYQPAQLRGKRMLDVGCGDGSLANAIASTLATQVVAFDLSRGMTRSARNASAMFIQADASDPPFKQDAFDVVWAGGSIHHTRNTRQTFFALVPLLKPGGRIGVWVYGNAKENSLRMLAKPYLVVGLQKLVFDHLGRGAQDVAINVLAQVGMIKQSLEGRLGIRRRPKSSLAQKKARLRDGLTVKYQHHHSRPEVSRWFEEAGLKAIVCRRMEGAVVCYGDKS